MIKEAKEDEVFIAKNNIKAKNIFELKKAIETMNDEEFSHHLNNDKNDFANWIEYSLEDKILADSVRQSKTKEEVLRSIDNRTSLLTKEIGKSHIISDFTLLKDFLIGLIIGLVAGGIIGKLLL
ncbi:MAG: hypothetical protein QXG00_00865 [Candidatus Woesearchaeota archaeon]